MCVCVCVCWGPPMGARRAPWGPGAVIVDPLGAPRVPHTVNLCGIFVVVPFHFLLSSSCTLAIVELLLSRLTSLITSCFSLICLLFDVVVNRRSLTGRCADIQFTVPRLAPSLSIPWGPQGFPYGASLGYLCCAFLSFPLVIILHLLSSFNFSYHVLLLLSRLAFAAPIDRGGDPLI